MSDYVQAPLPDPKLKHTLCQKTLRTHDGRRGNRLAVKVYIDEDGLAWAESVSGVCTPDHMGASQMRMMMRELGYRMRDWATEHGAEIGPAGGKDLISGEWS